MSELVGIEEFVCSTLALACNQDRATIHPQTSLFELNLDSLSLVSVLAQVEAVFTVQLTPDEMLRLIGASRIADLVNDLERIVARG